jgi:hypothetical protein
MKRFFSALVLVCALSGSTVAGDIPIPPAPPSCQIDCAKLTTTITTLEIPELIRVLAVDLLIEFLRP